MSLQYGPMKGLALGEGLTPSVRPFFLYPEEMRC
jgi:hypothetical protein